MKNGNDLMLGHAPDGSAIRISRDQRGKHIYSCGATGSGKSKFLESLCRQDMLNWMHSGCGMMVIDPHGSMYHALMAWAASHDLKGLPIIPIDLRRNDWIISYNVLRRRADADIAAVVGNFTRAIAHAWGKSGLEDTPRLSKFLRMILSTLYENNLTLGEALHFIRSPHVRRQMIAKVEDVVARSVFEMASQLDEAAFLDQVESTVSRLIKFLSTKIMRATLCQSGVSLDLGKALRMGSIMLVSLATQGSQIDDEDAATFGSILLSDLWCAAKSRGKHEGGARETIKPFYVFIDEFQEFVTPVIAKTLDQARGFGLHMCLAQQFPAQLTGQGEHGRLVWNSVMANTRTKVVFQMDHPDDLPLLTAWLGRNAVDADQIKHQPWSTKVMGYGLQYFPSFAVTTSDTSSESENQSRTDGRSSSVARSHMHTEGTSDTRSLDHGARDHFETDYGLENNEFDGNLEDLSSLDVPLRDQPAPERVTLSESFSEGASHTDSASDTRGMTETEGANSAQTVGTGKSRAQGMTQSLGFSPMLMPIMGKEKGTPVFRSIDEQLFILSQRISSMPDRHFLVRLAGEAHPQEGVTHTVSAPLVTQSWINKWTLRRLQALPFALPMQTAMQRIVDRERLLGLYQRDLEEPPSVRRRLL